jgi:hypothetical protein
MAVSAERVTVSTTAVALHPAESGISGGRLLIRNTHASDGLVLGASDVTGSTGFTLEAGEVLDIDYSGGERIYAIRGASADIVAHVLRLGE